MQYRQGDLLIVAIDALPTGVEQVQPENGRLVLARGEATGHHHSIGAETARLFRNGRGELFLECAENSELIHQEHSTILLPARAYRVVRQREYDGKSKIEVTD